MKTPKLPSFLARKNLLKRKEESDYQANKGEIQRRKYLEEIKQLKQQNKVENRNEKYVNSRTGRFGSRLKRGINAIKSPKNYLYSRNQVRVNRGVNNGRKGRPINSVKYRDDQGRPIGVYEFRKLLATKNYIARQQALQRATINPQQQQVLNNIRARENYNRSNKEGHIFPDTDGNVNIDSITDEINRASNIFS